LFQNERKMSEFTDIIISRRSIRKYTEQEVTDLQIEELLKAAMYAPSAGNQQPWHFVIIRNKETFSEIHEFHPFSQMLDQASVAIAVCADLSLETKKGYWMIDCAAATENVLLAAHAMELGAVWLGIYPREERMAGLKKLLVLPETVEAFSLISIGYPAEEKKLPNRFKTDRIHTEKW
jgi:nitroreductase